MWALFGPLIATIAGIVLLAKGLFTAVISIFTWLGTAFDYVIGSADFALEIGTLDWLPMPITAVFMAMVAFSVLCCIFGRIR